ncbi:response regulator [Gracilinema caldarium]|uniref:Response regulator receiver protein n=1 Tax=Gracilinema caldarium (strain ATCC 51460 / DSM 7334 / H1) TaxID=744872 RepID=F8EY04_GRAC1|nr:response regulator [Gracilinema caldarium]AEJ20665.1 response regulator receiver protein [Gracilinema caldarium DSM 7334]
MPKQAMLCVDDEAIIVIAMKQELKNHFGNTYYLDTALSAQEAFNKIDEMVENGIELVVIISDWLMPGMKGDEFLSIIHEKYPHVVSILVTGQADAEAIDRAMQNAKIKACLKKPWRSRELISVIERALQNPLAPTCEN